MYKTVTTAIVLSSLAANADILSSTQRFFGLGGQVPAYLQQNEEIQATELGQAPYSPADSDLGIQEILVERSGRAPIIFDLGTSILRTDTAPSGSAQDRSSWVFITSAALTWRPHLFHGVFADIGLDQDIVRYDRTNATDFENLSSRVGVFKVLPYLDDTVVFARYEYQRLTSDYFDSGDYNAQRIRAGIQKVIGEAPRHQLSSSISGAYEWTARPEFLRRNELAVDLNYRYSITDSLYTQASVAAARFNYEQFGRDDWTYAMSLSLINQFTENFRVNASVFFDKNDSDTFGSFNEYEAWSGGLGIGAQWRF